MAAAPASPVADRERPARRGGGFDWATTRQPRRHDAGYSRLVSLLRYLLPFLAVGLLALVAIWPQIQRGVEGMRLQSLKLDPGEVSTLRMSNARYQGLDERNRPYLLTADAAIQNPKDKNFLALEGPKADMTLESGAWVTISAASGVYDNAHKVLDLMGTVRVFHDNGHTFETDIARVDLATGQIEGDDPVHGQGPSGTIDAEGFRVLKRGETIQFKGKSRLVMQPGDPSPVP